MQNKFKNEYFFFKGANCPLPQMHQHRERHLHLHQTSRPEDQWRHQDRKLAPNFNFRSKDFFSDQSGGQRNRKNRKTWVSSWSLPDLGRTERRLHFYERSGKDGRTQHVRHCGRYRLKTGTGFYFYFTLNDLSGFVFLVEINISRT